MKTEQHTDLEICLYSFLDSRVNTHLRHLEYVFEDYEPSEIKQAADRLIERGLIYEVGMVNNAPIYATESKRNLQTPYP